MKRRIPLAIFIIALVFTTVVVEVKAQNSTVTLTTANNDNSPTQYPADAYSVVTLNKTMTYNSAQGTFHPTDGLVGVQIQAPNGNIMVIRTLSTGTTVPYNIAASVTAYLCNGEGNQINSISIPSGPGNTPSLYFDVSNNLNTPQPVLVTFNIYDSNGVPIVTTYQQLNLTSLGSSPNIFDFSIPSWTHYGTAYAYVDVFNTWPSQGGYPLGEECAFQFTITGETAFQGITPTTQSLNGDPTNYFSMSFRLPQYENLALGTYTAYSTTNYDGVTGSQTTTFGVAELADITGSGTVNFNDIVAFVALYINYFANGVYSSTIDFIHNGKVINFNDVVLFVAYYIQAWSS